MVIPKAPVIPRIGSKTASKAKNFFYSSDGIKMYFPSLILRIELGFWGFRQTLPIANSGFPYSPI